MSFKTMFDFKRSTFIPFLPSFAVRPASACAADEHISSPDPHPLPSALFVGPGTDPYGPPWYHDHSRVSAFPNVYHDTMASPGSELTIDELIAALRWKIETGNDGTLANEMEEARSSKSAEYVA